MLKKHDIAIGLEFSFWIIWVEIGENSMHYSKIINFKNNGKKCCIFGAGKIGSGQAYTFLKDLGFEIDCYFDNQKPSGTKIHDEVCVAPINQLYENHEQYNIFIGVGAKILNEVKEQLENNGIKDYLWISQSEINELLDSIDTSDDDTKKLFESVYDDAIYLKRKFYTIHGYPLDLDTPKRFNEKLQWLKLHDRNEKYTRLVDKYLVKEYVAETIGEDYVIPTLGVYDSFEDIDFESLPDQFVMKCTHDSGSIYFVENKNYLDVEAAKKLLGDKLNVNHYWLLREWAYKNVKPRIIVEPYIMDESKDLKDYKFFVFGGEAKLMFIASNRNSDKETTCDCFDMNFIHLPVEIGHHNSEGEFEKPEKFDEMKMLAEKLGKGIPQVRVDLYCVKGQILFGEMTFYHWGGSAKIQPEEWDYKMGDWIQLPDKK